MVLATQQTPAPPPSSSTLASISTAAVTTTNTDLKGCSAMDSTLTTYVQTDPTSFRAVVQRLTGAPEGSPNRLPLTRAARFASDPSARKPSPPSAACGTKKQKLQERRCAPSKLAIDLGPEEARYRPHRSYHQQLCGKGEVFLLSPVSTMDPFLLLSSPSPTTPSSTSSPLPSAVVKDEERSMAEKGFYLHPSPRGGGEPPKLLPLFPLQPPRQYS